MKLRQLSELQDLLDRDHSWRIKELSEVKSMSYSQQNQRQRIIIRAGIALAYAHWEGFIKKSAEWYLVYINSQRHTYRELKTEFCVFGIKGELNKIVHSKKHKLNTEVFDFIVQNLDTRVYMALSNAIDTESNLSSEVFDNIAFSIGINSNPYSLKYHFIDESLVKRRNEIAHGEDPGLDVSNLFEVVDIVIDLMRQFKNDLENNASGKNYLK